MGFGDNNVGDNNLGDNNNIDVYLHGIELWLTRYKNKWIGREVDTINSEAQIEWEFYFDLRTWGVKEIGVTAKKIELQVDIDCFVGKSENNNTEAQQEKQKKQETSRKT